MTEKNNAATISAAEQQLVGWPVPDSDVARILSIRSVVALFRSRVIREAFAEAIESPSRLNGTLSGVCDAGEPNKHARRESMSGIPENPGRKCTPKRG
jgi:hypothetical protein